MNDYKPTEFHVLLDRLKAGDPDAAEEFVHRYSRLVRMAARAKLSNRIRHVLDSEDILQSVMLKFFTECRNYEFEEPINLIAHLATITRNRAVDRLRYMQARDLKANAAPGDVIDALPDPNATAPSAIVQHIDTWEAVNQAMNDEERQLALLRSKKMCWDQIAGEMGGSPDARRMQYNRLMARLRSRFDDAE